MEFDAIFNFSIIVFFVILNSTWSLNDDLFTPETELLSNADISASDQLLLPTNPNSSPQDESDIFWGDAPPNDDGDIAESFDLVDCSSSNSFPAFGKSRIRRRDESTRCKNPSLTSPPSDNFPFGTSADPLAGLQLFTSFRRNRRKNTACDALTFNVLPFGVCNSGIDALPSIIMFVSIGGSLFIPVDLQHCSPGEMYSSICPVPEKLYCCARVYEDRKDKTNLRGDVCVSISEVMGEPQMGAPPF